MRIQPNEMRQYLAKIRAHGLKVPPGFWDLSVEQICEVCNGIGSDDPSTKWLVGPTNWLVSWMIILSIPHDVWWSEYCNDGSRERYLQSNREFRDNGEIESRFTLGWVWPRPLRRDLQNGRAWEAQKGKQILDSDACWEIWKKNAAVEPGPEVAG